MSTNLSVRQQLSLDPPGTQLPTLEWVVVTPELAEEWLGKNHGNRAQRRRGIDNLSRDITTGDFLMTGDSIKFDWDGVLIDGQHRLEAVIKSQMPIHVVVCRGLDPRVKSVLDTQIRRSAADALKFSGVSSFATTIAGIARISIGIDTGFLKNARQMSLPLLTNAEVVEWYAANMDAGEAAAFAGQVYKKINATPAPLGYCILATSRIDPVISREFFEDLKDLRTQGKGDPRATLLSALSTMRERRTANSAAMQLAYIFRAWNALREGRELSVLRARTGSRGSGGPISVTIPEPK